MSDIIEENDGFYYWDDNDDLIGPFTTIQQVEVALDATLKWESKDHRSTIRKMKDNMGI